MQNDLRLIKRTVISRGKVTTGHGCRSRTPLDMGGNSWHSASAMLRINDTISIDEAELEERFTHASGPGGQNVNKVASAVQLRFPLAYTTSLPELVRFKLMQAAGSKLTKDGWLVITAQDTRDQVRNREIARERLATMIREAAVPEKRRRKTRPPRSANRKRLEAKKNRGRIKQNRGKVRDF